MIDKLTNTELEEGHERFRKEEGRYSFYDMAHALMQKGFKTEGRLLLLAGWNGAWFSKVARDFKIEEFEDLMDNCEPLFAKLNGKKLEDLNISEVESGIKGIYEKLANCNAIKYTGASKLMSLEIPELFVMWDMAIRERYGIRGQDSKNYIEFLNRVKDATKDVVWGGDKTGVPLAKAIDEYNYVTITLGIDL